MHAALSKRIFNLTPDKICPICRDDENLMTKKNYIVTEVCGHVFHINCYKTHIKETKECPLCRTKQDIEKKPDWSDFRKFYESEYYYEFMKLARHFIYTDCEEDGCDSCDNCGCCSVCDSTFYKDVVHWRCLIFNAREDDEAAHNVSFNFIRTFADKIGWETICSDVRLTEGFIKEFETFIDWECISENMTLTVEFMTKYADKLDWERVNNRRHVDKLSTTIVNKILKNANAACSSFIKVYEDKVDWTYINENISLTDKFIKEFKTRIDWTLITKNESLTSRLISDNINKINITALIKNQKLSIDTIYELTNYSCIGVDDLYGLLCQYQDLPESFLRDMSDHIDWKTVSRYQKLSEEFVVDFLDELDLYLLIKYGDLSEEFTLEHLNLSRL